MSFFMSLLCKIPSKSFLIWSENSASQKSDNANANSQAKINSLASIRHEIPLKGNSEKNRITKSPWHR